MKKTILCALLTAGVLTSATAATVGVDPSRPWVGYMNVTELPANGGAFAFGSVWGVADLPAVFSGTTLTIGPNVNTYKAGDSFWVQPNGEGNKQMTASFYVEDSSLAGSPVLFNGNVIANTLVSPYTSVAFIKEFTPGYGFVGMATAPLVGGSAFQVNYSPAAGNLVQYGFETVGPDANPATASALGNVQIVAVVPEPGTMALALTGLAMLAILRKRA